LTYWFTDTPYFGRFDNKNLKPDNHYWRICKNNIHVPFIENLDDKRLEKFNVKIKDKRQKGEHILVCPSSFGIHNYLKEQNLYDEMLSEEGEIPELDIEQEPYMTCFGIDVYERGDELISEKEYAQTL